MPISCTAQHDNETVVRVASCQTVNLALLFPGHGLLTRYVTSDQSLVSIAILFPNVLPSGHTHSTEMCSVFLRILWAAFGTRPCVTFRLRPFRFMKLMTLLGHFQPSAQVACLLCDSACLCFYVAIGNAHALAFLVVNPVSNRLLNGRVLSRLRSVKRMVCRSACNYLASLFSPILHALF